MEINFSLADSELDSYFYCSDENKLTLKIKLWDERIVVFSFTDPVLHIDHFRNEITNIFEISKQSQLLEDTLKTIYEVIPNDHPYKLYQFHDLNNSPCIEIICRKIDVESI